MEIEFNRDFLPRVCKRCGFEGIPKPDRKHDLHGYALYCPSCGIFLAWGGRKKQIKSEGVRSFSTQWTPSRLGIDACQVCLRDKFRLGSGQLHSHHVVAIKDGGKDEPGNIWVVCTSCHRLIHHQRTYVNDHLSPIFEVLARIKKQYPEIFAHEQVEACNG